MKNKILTFLLSLTIVTACGQNKMEQKFITWDNFVDGFGKEMVSFCLRRFLIIWLKTDLKTIA